MLAYECVLIQIYYKDISSFLRMLINPYESVLCCCKHLRLTTSKGFLSSRITKYVSNVLTSQDYCMNNSWPGCEEADEDRLWQCTFFLAARPLLLANLPVLSMEAARRRGDFPLLPPSGFSIHHELFPVPSFCTRTKRLCRERLCRIEF